MTGMTLGDWLRAQEAVASAALADDDTTRDGRWLVEDDWDDTDCYLVLVRELKGDDDDHK